MNFFEEERPRLNPLHGIGLFLIIMLLFLFCICPFTAPLWHVWGLLLTDAWSSGCDTAGCSFYRAELSGGVSHPPATVWTDCGDHSSLGRMLSVCYAGDTGFHDAVSGGISQYQL